MSGPQAKPILYIGNRNYSSWSLRGWLAMQKSGLAFDERLIVLDTTRTVQEIRAVNPAGRVPALVTRDGLIWDSLSIMEWAAERAREADGRMLWPRDPFARAVARSAAAEMHGGFQALRSAYPMNLKRVGEARSTPAPDEAAHDVRRVIRLWTDLRAQFGKGGPWLFGHWSLADAAFAPVATRLRSYAVDTDPRTEAYIDVQLADPEFRDWRALALAETWTEGDIDTY